MKLLLVGLVLLSLPLHAIEISRNVSPNVVHIGDVVHFNIQASYDADVSLVSVPEADDFEGVSFRSKTIVKNKGAEKLQLTLQYSLSFFNTGIQRIPSLNVVFKRGEDLLTFALPATPVRIDALLSDDPYETVKLEGLLDPFSVQISWEQYRRIVLYSSGLIILILVAGFYALRWIRSRRQCVVVPLDLRSAAQKALDELDELQALQYIEKHQVKHYYLELTDILKRYFSVLCEAPISEMTSTESLLVLEQALSPKTMGTIREFFELSDLVKFAKFSPDGQAHVRSFQAVKGVIEEEVT